VISNKPNKRIVFIGWYKAKTFLNIPVITCILIIKVAFVIWVNQNWTRLYSMHTAVHASFTL